ncbi:acidic mammalian chitinase-like isoform X7 [Rhipicephalus microplus]|uniref:acidic mammalian chitinase-like isoform X7 n=1 Tax=Rhipicephalus microplus TaxID=6941 RepID=UPI003F6BB4EA
MALNATQLAANLTAQLLAQSGNALSDIRNVEYAMGTMAMLFLAAYYRAYSQLYKHYKENLATYRHPDDRRHRYYEMKRVCYYLLPRRGGATDWSSELNPDVLDDTLCTHVLVGALAVSAQGRLVTKLPKHEDLISKISRSKLKVLLSVDAKDTTALSYVVAYRWTRLRFIRSAMRMVWRYKLSGINLDWQIPGWLSSHVGDRYLFRLLLQDFRSYMKETKKAFLLSASICAIPAVMPSTYDVRGLSRYVDFINLVAHDLDIYRPWRPNTSHHSPLFPKLLNKHGGLTAESCVCQLLKEGSVTVMDKMAYAPYAYLGDVWISYENVESVVLKHGAVTNISRRQNRDAGAPTEKMEAAYVPPGAAAMEPRATDKVQAIVTS